MKRRRNPTDPEQALAQLLLLDELDDDIAGFTLAGSLRTVWILSTGRQRVSALRSARTILYGAPAP